MKYNQPHNVDDPQAPYIDGDPTIGQRGSVPPAASIEYPQREIVSVIQWAYDNKYVDMNGALCEAPTNSYLDQLLKALFGIMNSRLLHAPKTYYVNGSTGNDTNDGLTPASAFATIQKALDTTTTWNQNGFGVTINVAAGTYDGVLLPQLNGTGGCSLIGSGTSNCTISSVNKSAIRLAHSTGGYDISNFTLTCSGTASDPSDHVCGVQVEGPSQTVIHDVKFLSCGQAHMMTIAGATLIVSNAIEIAGSAGIHISSEWGSEYLHSQASYTPILTISAPVTFNPFCHAANGSLMVCNYSSIAGSVNVTGSRYYAGGNSIIQTSGGGANYLPGTTPGSVDTGGQYL